MIPHKKKQKLGACNQQQSINFTFLRGTVKQTDGRTDRQSNKLPTAALSAEDYVCTCSHHNISDIQRYLQSYIHSYILFLYILQAAALMLLSVICQYVFTVCLSVSISIQFFLNSFSFYFIYINFFGIKLLIIIDKSEL